MRVLIAKQEAATGEPWDFYWCEEGELLALGILCGRDFKDDIAHCGCSRAFSGTETAKATTVGVVGLLSEDEVAERLSRARAVLLNESEGMEGYGELVAIQIAALSEELERLEAREGEAFRVLRRSDDDGEEFELKRAVGLPPGHSARVNQP